MIDAWLHRLERDSAATYERAIQNSAASLSPQGLGPPGFASSEREGRGSLGGGYMLASPFQSEPPVKEQWQQQAPPQRTGSDLFRSQPSASAEPSARQLLENWLETAESGQREHPTPTQRGPILSSLAPAKPPLRGGAGPGVERGYAAPATASGYTEPQRMHHQEATPSRYSSSKPTATARGRGHGAKPAPGAARRSRSSSRKRDASQPAVDPELLDLPEPKNSEAMRKEIEELRRDAEVTASQLRNSFALSR